MVAGVRSRPQLITECDVIVLPKPTEHDIAELREGQVLWGWPHCVQDYAVTQLGIDRRLTLTAWEAMNYWAANGSFGVHVFHMNNELAGYCSVLHSLQLLGMTGAYGCLAGYLTGGMRCRMSSAVSSRPPAFPLKSTARSLASGRLPRRFRRAVPGPA